MVIECMLVFVYIWFDLIVSKERWRWWMMLKVFVSVLEFNFTSSGIIVCTTFTFKQNFDSENVACEEERIEDI